MSFAFHNLHDFMVMGHYGVYVWSAWLITLIALLSVIFHSRRMRQKFFRDEITKLRIHAARVDRLKQDSLR